MSEDMDGQVIHREFAADLSASGDGRTLDLRVVPYNTPATVRDFGGEPYEEMWMPGVFDKQKNAANRVLVNFEHEQGISGIVGRGTELRSEDDGFHGSFRMLSSQDADKALELVNEDVLTGVSLEAIPQKSVREDGVVKRVKAHLINVALCRTPAYEDARVLAVRQQHNDSTGTTDVTINFPNYIGSPEELAAALALKVEPAPANADLQARLERIGFKPLPSMRLSKVPWDSNRERFDDDQWARSCLTGDKLPVLEPDGSINVDAIQRAARDIQRVALDKGSKGNAVRLLIRYFNVAHMDVPEQLRNLSRWL